MLKDFITLVNGTANVMADGAKGIFSEPGTEIVDGINKKLKRNKPLVCPSCGETFYSYGDASLTYELPQLQYINKPIGGWVSNRFTCGDGVCWVKEDDLCTSLSPYYIAAMGNDVKITSKYTSPIVKLLEVRNES